MPKDITEFGYKDPVEIQGKWRLIWPRVREIDPLWLDPPISDGKLGKEGVDTRYQTELFYREKPGIPDAQWRKELYFNSPNIKHIYDNWKISKEHPGFTVLPYLYGPEAPLSHFSNAITTPAVFSTYLGKYFPALTWSFYDGPFGTNCLKKTVVPARTMTYIATLMWFFDVAFYNPVDSVYTAFKKYPKVCGFPIIASGVWGSLSCFACQVRQKDDWKNMAFSGLGVAMVANAKYSVMRSASLGIFVGAVGSLWRYFLDCEYGVFGRGAPQKQTGLSDPLTWKWLTMETSWRDVPTKNW